MSVPLGLVVEVVRYQMCQHELSQLPTPLLINIYLTATPAVIALSYVVLPLPVVSAKPHRHELFVRALALALTLRTIDPSCYRFLQAHNVVPHLTHLTYPLT